MKPYDIHRYLQGKKELSRVYLVYGEETFLIDETVAQLKARFLDPKITSLNLNAFSGKDADIKRVASSIGAAPMMGDHRLVIVGHIDQAKKSAREKLIPYITSPPKTVYQIYTASKINGREKFYAAVKKNGMTVECKPLYDNQVPRWIESQFQKIGKKIDSRAIQQLHLSVGSQLYDLANEIEKLDIYTQDKKVVTSDHVAFVVGKWRVNSVFDLQKMLGNRQAGEAMVLMRKIIERGEPPVKIVSVLMYFYLGLIKVHTLLKHQTSRSDIAKKARINPYFIGETMTRAKRFRREELEHNLSLLYQVDLALKTSSVPVDALMERLAYQLCAKIGER